MWISISDVHWYFIRVLACLCLEIKSIYNMVLGIYNCHLTANTGLTFHNPVVRAVSTEDMWAIPVCLQSLKPIIIRFENCNLSALFKVYLKKWNRSQKATKSKTFININAGKVPCIQTWLMFLVSEFFFRRWRFYIMYIKARDLDQNGSKLTHKVLRFDENKGVSHSLCHIGFM